MFDQVNAFAAPIVTVLHGSPQRTMLSFYKSVTQLPNESYVGVVAGNFEGDAAIQDLVAFLVSDVGPAVARV